MSLPAKIYTLKVWCSSRKILKDKKNKQNIICEIKHTTSYIKISSYFMYTIYLLTLFTHIFYTTNGKKPNNNPTRHLNQIIPCLPLHLLRRLLFLQLVVLQFFGWSMFSKILYFFCSLHLFLFYHLWHFVLFLF